MPPKIGTASQQEFDIRITPVDQMPITKEHIQESDLHTSDIIIVAEEGGTPQLKLHYHLYVKAKLSETKLRQICSLLGRATKDIKGNAVYSIRKAHTHTIGYVVKNKNIIYHNQNQSIIDTYFELSDDYKKAKEADRKRAFRKQKEIVANIMKAVVVDNSSTPSSITRDILQKHNEHRIRFPSRTTMETMVMTLYYKEKPLEVEGFYTKNFLFL